jgi:type I restriction enzyme R subunit
LCLRINNWKKLFGWRRTNCGRESVQATLRRNIRRILRKHGYPPDLQEKAVQTVIDQARLLANDLVTN